MSLTSTGSLLNLSAIIAPFQQGPFRQLTVPSPGGGEPASISVLPLNEHGGSLIVAVPKSAWDRRAAHRKLPRGGLVRPAAIEVAAAGEAGESNPVLTVKVWVQGSWIPPLS